MGAYVQRVNAEVNSDELTYITPSVARMAIEKHFGNFVSSNSTEYASELNDIEVLANVVDAYNEMLIENDGFVSVDGVKHVCEVAFSDLEPKANIDDTDVQNQKCIAFATDLATMQATTQNKCKYNVTKVNGSQMHIKYTRSDGTGFTRDGGNIPWRFFNPGAMRDSSLSCAIISTKPNGDFAVFADEATGRKALHLLLSTSSKYKGRPIREAIKIYAPKKENNTALYVQKLKKLGINVDKVLPNLTAEEWTELESAITTLEGWGPNGPSYGGTGTVNHF